MLPREDEFRKQVAHLRVGDEVDGRLEFYRPWGAYFTLPGGVLAQVDRGQLQCEHDWCHDHGTVLRVQILHFVYHLARTFVVPVREQRDSKACIDEPGAAEDRTSSQVTGLRAGQSMEGTFTGYRPGGARIALPGGAFGYLRVHDMQQWRWDLAYGSRVIVRISKGEFNPRPLRGHVLVEFVEVA